MHKQEKNIPKCIGIIMDGNRRWARKRGLPVYEGHRAGYKKLKEMLTWAKEAEVKTVIAYAFSTENWNRSKLEVGFLMKLLRNVLVEEIADIKKERVRVRFIGDLDKFPKDIQEGIRTLEEETRPYKENTLVLAISYGGRAEIVSAVKKIAQEKTKEEIGKITEREFSKYLWTKDIPDPDLIVRTGGEKRLSNFLPWQSVYSEFYFTPTLWPAFSRREFHKIIAEFATRERRKGV
ncbi:MAG: polyprenyl diphosphate synthase [Candidatus Yonathbacteria bacterium]|nr:polyprenyl diphosphate synthase [Candidatus Yonathbacteria bacterium]